MKEKSFAASFYHLLPALINFLSEQIKLLSSYMSKKTIANIIFLIATHDQT